MTLFLCLGVKEKQTKTRSLQTSPVRSILKTETNSPRSCKMKYDSLDDFYEKEEQKKITRLFQQREEEKRQQELNDEITVKHIAAIINAADNNNLASEIWKINEHYQKQYKPALNYGYDSHSPSPEQYSHNRKQSFKQKRNIKFDIKQKRFGQYDRMNIGLFVEDFINDQQDLNMEYYEINKCVNVIKHKPASEIKSILRKCSSLKNYINQFIE